MKKLINLFPLITILVVTSSCGISYKMPDNRFETPEVNLESSQFGVKGAIGSGKDIELTPDFSHITVSTDYPTIRSENIVQGQISVGLIKNLEIGAKYITDMGLGLNAKYQLVGTKGEKGFKLAVNTHAGFGSETKEETYSTPSKAEMKNSFIGGDFIMGWRTGRDLLLYTSIFHDSAFYEVTQTRGTNSQKYEGTSKNTGGTFGLNWDISKNASIILEFARAKATSGKTNFTSSAYGASMKISTF